MATQASKPTQARAARRSFSMIEVVLGLGLIAFGLISIAALFPTGLRANQAALGETYAAEHADQFLHILKAEMIAPASGETDNWETYARALPDSKPGSSEPGESNWESWRSQGVTSYEIGGSDHEFYRIRQVGMDSSDTQFSAVCRVWRTPVLISHYDDGVWEDIQFTSDKAIALNLEISWPASKPYASRRKSLFMLEVYRPED